MATETPRAKEAFADYLALGPDRSLAKLAKAYQSRIGSVPTKQISTLREWSADFAWQDRIKDMATEQAAKLAEAETDEKLRVLQEGFALKHERIRALNRLAGTLLDELEGGRLWVTDVKQIGGGDNAERVEVERFNNAELEQFRALLDDITKETGERVKLEKRELSGKDGGPIVTKRGFDLSGLTDEELDVLERVSRSAYGDSAT